MLVFRKTRAGSYFSSLVLIFFIGVGNGVLPHLALLMLQKEARLNGAEWKQKNMIVILGGGVVRWPTGDLSTQLLVQSRVMESARLYRSCKIQSQNECLILASGGDPSGQGKSEAEVMKAELAELGVPPDDIFLDAKSKNTFENAKFSAQIISNVLPQQIILVTSGIHLHRSLMLFEHFGVHAIGAPSDHIESGLSILPRSINFVLADLAAHELLGTWRFWFYNLMGWNGRG